MKAFEISDLIDEQNRSGHDYIEFLRVHALSAGIYVLAAGAVDRQQPHTEDEIYYVLSGRSSILVGDENREVQAGSLIYIKANVKHRFHSIHEELRLLVIFAPAENTNASIH